MTSVSCVSGCAEPSGVALLLAQIGYAALAGFLVLHLDEIGVGHGAAVFTAFAITVVGSRLLLSWLPDRIGPRASVGLAATAQAVGLVLIAVAGSLAVVVAGALVMVTGFSLSFPSLALIVVDEVDERTRGAAMGAFTAFFDVGVGIGGFLLFGAGGYARKRQMEGELGEDPSGPRPEHRRVEDDTNATMNVPPPPPTRAQPPE